MSQGTPIRRGLRALVLLLAIGWASQAEAGWVQVSVPAGVSSTAQLNDVVVAGSEVWVVGIDGTAPVVIRGFETPTFVPQATHGATAGLNAACGMADGSLHAFGKSGAHASFDHSTSSWDSRRLFTGFNANEVSCAGTNTVYISGGLTTPAVYTWIVPQATATLADSGLSGTFEAADFRGVGDGVLAMPGETDAFDGAGFFPLPDPGLGSAIVKSISFEPGGTGLAAAASTTSLVARIGTDNTMAVTGSPGILNVSDVELLSPTFAIAVGSSGEAAISFDWGASWQPWTVPGSPNLRAVACADRARCYAVGDPAAMYYWANEAPSATISATVNATPASIAGGSLQVAEGDVVCLSASGSDPEGATIGWLWHEPTRQLVGLGGPIDGTTLATPECFVAPSTCSSLTFDIDAVASDGALTGTASLALVVQPSSSLATSLTPSFSGMGAGQTLASGSGAVSLAASGACAGSWSYLWNCDDGVNPGAAQATRSFSHPGTLCADRTVRCSVQAVPDVGNPASTNFSVTYLAAPGPTALTQSSSGLGAGDVLAANQSATVTITPASACGSSYTWSWSCSDGIDPGSASGTRGFTHPGEICAPQEVSCSVTATPDNGEPATASFVVTYAAAPGPTTVSQAPVNLGAGNVLAAGQSGEVQLVPDNGCASSYAFSWNCSDGIAPGSTADRRSFTHPGTLCAASTVQCTVGITPDVGPSVETSFSVQYEASPGEIVASARPIGLDAGNVLASGSASVAIDVQNACSATYSYSWSCSDEQDPGPLESSRAFTHPGILCAEQPISCTVLVSSDLGQTTQADFTVRLAAEYGATLVTTTASGFGAGNVLAPASIGTVALEPRSACATSYTYGWACDDGQNPGLTQASRSFTHPGSLCAQREVVCSVQVTPDVGEPALVETRIAYQADPGPTTLELQTSGFSTGTVVAEGGEGIVAVVPTSACATGYSWAWSCSDGSTSSGQERRFPHPGSLCAPETISCEVLVDAAGGLPASQTVEVTFEASSSLPTTIDAQYSGFTATDALDRGQTGSVSIAAQGPCASSFALHWSCDDGVSLDGPARDFAHPGPRCSETTVRCDVTAVPDRGDPGSTQVVVRYLAGAPTTATLAFSPEMPGGVLPDSSHGSVSVVPESLCATSYDVAWSCAGSTSQGLSRAFTHPGRLCLPQTVGCQVQITPQPLGDSFSMPVDVVFGSSLPFPVELAYSPSSGFVEGVRLEQGQSARAEILATHCRDSASETFRYDWSCQGPGVVAPGAEEPSVTFTHPGSPPPLCADSEARCALSVVPLIAGQPSLESASSLSPYVVLAPAFDPPSNLRAVTVSSTPQALVLEAAVDLACPMEIGFEWTATLRSSGALLASASSTRLEVTLPELCGQDVVDVSLRETTSGVSVEQAIPVEAWRGALQIEPAVATDYEPDGSPRLDCLELAPAVVRPRVTGCLREVRWRQLTELPLDLEARADGSVAVTPRADAFGSVVGRAARLEATALNDEGSATESFELLFVPAPFVRLEHRADRPVVAAGEEVRFRLGLGSGCSAAPNAIDVHLALSDLGYVAGSARLDGAPIADPERQGRELVFRALPFRPGEQAPVLEYRARREVVGSSEIVGAVASAYLSVAPEMLVSEEAPASESLERPGGVAALSCNCGQSGGPMAAPWLAGVALALLGIRRRAGARARLFRA